MKRALVPLMLVAALGAVAERAAARPPAGRVYYAVTMGLTSAYGFDARCFAFVGDRLCSLDGEICGTWRATGGGGAGLAFDLTTLADGEVLRLDGSARLDGRGRSSSLAGAGRISHPEAGTANFSFAAREVSESRCLKLVDDGPGSEEPPQVYGSGNVVTEEREVGDFHGLIAEGVALIELRVGSAPSLRITADDNLLPILTSEVRDGRLVLDASAPFQTRNDVRWEVTVPELDEIGLSGVIGAEVTGIDTERLAVSVGGVSSLTAAGRVDRQVVKVTGVSRYDARDLASRLAEVEIHGVSWAVVRVSERLSGSVTGGGTLEYIGNPTLDVVVDPLSTLRGAR